MKIHYCNVLQVNSRVRYNPFDPSANLQQLPAKLTIYRDFSKCNISCALHLMTLGETFTSQYTEPDSECCDRKSESESFPCFLAIVCACRINKACLLVASHKRIFSPLRT